MSKQDKKTLTWKEMSKTQKIAYAVILVVVLCLTVALFSGGKKADNTSTSSEQTATKTTNEDGSIETTENGVSKDDLITYCQEKHIILKQLISKSRDISLIYVWDYNSKVWEIGTYTSDGDKIYMVQWNGKDKDYDKIIRFTCYMSAKDKENIRVHQVLADTEVLDGILVEYNKDGKVIE